MRIGIFDSGLGGLTVLAALRRLLPAPDVLYLGDTARIPYGTRSAYTVVRYALRVASYLDDQGIDLLVVACNTATTHALPALQAAGARRGLPVVGVVEPGVEAALAALGASPTDRGVGVLGTVSTIEGAAYQRALTERAPGVRVHAVACPLFVPLVEEGWTDGPVPEAVADAYVAGLRNRIGTAILGCTHYPLLRPVLARALPGVTLVDSAEATAAAVAARLGEAGHGGAGRTTFFATDNPDRFREVGGRFLGAPVAAVDWVDLPEARDPWRTAGTPPAGIGG